jgi:hypothetical protein
VNNDYYQANNQAMYVSAGEQVSSDGHQLKEQNS